MDLIDYIWKQATKNVANQILYAFEFSTTRPDHKLLEEIIKLGEITIISPMSLVISIETKLKNKEAHKVIEMCVDALTKSKLIRPESIKRYLVQKKNSDKELVTVYVLIDKDES